MLKNHVYGLGRGMITIDTTLITPNLWERANSVCVCRKHCSSQHCPLKVLALFTDEHVFTHTSSITLQAHWNMR